MFFKITTKLKRSLYSHFHGHQHNLHGFLPTAVVEGRGLAKGEIGMAAINLKGSELSLFQVSFALLFRALGTYHFNTLLDSYFEFEIYMVVLLNTVELNGVHAKLIFFQLKNMVALSNQLEKY